jgi:hypothetical protein
MIVRELAPAHLSAADLFHTVNRRIDPTGREVQVNIRATHDGSVLIELKIIYDTYVGVLSNNALVGTERLAGLLVVAVGIIRYRRKLPSVGRADLATSARDA